MSEFETQNNLKVIVIAEGEATGHAHRAMGFGLRFHDGVLDIPESATLTHEEHGMRVLPAGKHIVRRVVELDPNGDVTEVQD